MRSSFVEMWVLHCYRCRQRTQGGCQTHPWDCGRRVECITNTRTRKTGDEMMALYFSRLHGCCFTIHQIHQIWWKLRSEDRSDLRFKIVSCQKHPHKIRAWCTIIPNLCHKVDLLLNNMLIFKFVWQDKGILKGQSSCHISTAANSNDKFRFIV